jgi:hypothetical protein
MIKWILFLLLNVLTLNVWAQLNTELDRYILHPRDSWLFMEQSSASSYTIRFDSDTMFQIGENMYFCMNRPIQIITAAFDNGDPAGVKGSLVKEKNALLHHMDAEIEFQSKQLKTNLNSGHKMFFNASGKPFLLWWHNIPENTREEGEIEFDAGRTSKLDTLLATGDYLSVSHMLAMTFIVRGNVTVSLSIPVLEREQVKNVMERMSRLMNGVTVYGGLIDINLFLDRMDVEDYVFKDSEGLVNIAMPNWFHSCYTGSPNWRVGTLPELKNIYNAISVYYVSKDEFRSFNEFVEKRTNDSRAYSGFRKTYDQDNMLRFFHKKSRNYFHCEEVFIKGEKAYAFLSFTSTSSTYKSNQHYFEEFLQGVTVH